MISFRYCGGLRRRRIVVGLAFAFTLSLAGVSVGASAKAHHKSLSRLEAGLKGVRDSSSKAKERLSALKKRESALNEKLGDDIRPQTVPMIDASLRYVRSEIAETKDRQTLHKKLTNLFDRGYTQALSLVVLSASSSDEPLTLGQVRKGLQRLTTKKKTLQAIDRVIAASQGPSPKSFEFAQAELEKIRFERKALNAKVRKCESDEQMILAEIDVVRGVQDEAPKPRDAAFIAPVPGKITSAFGSRVHPIDHIEKEHKGIDLAAETGDPVKASADGMVVFAGVQKGFGNIIIIRHENSMTTAYAHLSEIDVEVGDQVDQGQLIGKVGMTGNATGPHLHFEIRENDVAVDPEKYL